MLVRNLPLLGEGVVEPPHKWALFVFGGVTLLQNSRQLELKTANVRPKEPRLGPIEYLAHLVCVNSGSVHAPSSHQHLRWSQRTSHEMRPRV